MGRKKKTTLPVSQCKKLQHSNKVNNCTVNNEIINSKTTILDISGRLEKTFLNMDCYSNEENVIEYSFRPRRIFINGLCLVCLKMRRPEIICEFCKMVSYCSEKHKKQNYDEHKNLCAILKETYRTQKDFQLNCNLSPDQYRFLRVKLIDQIEKTLSRDLDLWEKEIILYPRICRICHSACDKCCPQCGVDFLCDVEEHSQEHLQWCSTFKIFRRITQLQREHGNTKPQIPNVISDVPYELPNDFDQVLARLIGDTKLYADMDSYNYAVLSHLSSAPLTALYTLQKTYDQDWFEKKSLTLHIIGAEFEYECADLRFWEKMFLHFLPSLKELKLIIVGPELQAPQFLLDALKNLQLCKSCSAKKKSIRIEFHPAKLYHEVSNLPNPDVICLFNPGLYRRTGFSTWDTWPATIRAFCKFKVPVVVSSYTEYEIPKDVARIESVCPVEILLKPQRNNFSSLKPDRNFVSDHTDPLIFKNYCLAIVKGM